MNISLTSKDWLCKTWLLPGPGLLMLCAVLMSATTHLLHLSSPPSWTSEFVLVAARMSSPKVKMPGFCFGTRTEHMVSEKELLFALAREGDCRHNPERLKWAEQSWQGPVTFPFLAREVRFPISYALKAHCLLSQEGLRIGHLARKPSSCSS